MSKTLTAGEIINGLKDLNPETEIYIRFGNTYKAINLDDIIISD